MKNISKLATAAAAAAALLFAACNSGSRAENAAKMEYGKQYRLVSMYQNGKELEFSGDTASVPDMVFDSSKVSGFAGVNRYFGKMEYDSKTGAIKLGPVASTMMAGPGMETESSFLENLNNARFIEFAKDSSLVILDSLKNKLMVLK